MAFNKSKVPASTAAPRVLGATWLLVLALPATWIASAADSQLDAVVVLGHRPPLDEHGVEYETRIRVERGVALFRLGIAKHIVFSGGRSTPEAIESEVMANYARSLGIPDAAILLETSSRDTIENAYFSVAMMRTKLGDAHPPRIMLVTSDYHLGRAANLFRCAGAELRGTSAVSLDLPWRMRAARRAREAFVHVAYWFIDECQSARSRR